MSDRKLGQTRGHATEATSTTTCMTVEPKSKTMAEGPTGSVMKFTWLSLSMTLRVSEAGFRLRMTSPNAAINCKQYQQRGK